MTALCVLFTANLAAQQRGGGQRMNSEERVKQQVESLKKELKLNAQQEKEVQTLLTESNKKRSEMFQKNRESDDRDARKAEMDKITADENAGMKKILTEDQYKSYTVWQENQRQKMEKQRGERGEKKNNDKNPADTPDGKAKSGDGCKSKCCEDK